MHIVKFPLAFLPFPPKQYNPGYTEIGKKTKP